MGLLPILLACALFPSPAHAQTATYDFTASEKALDQDLDPRYAADYLKNSYALREAQAADPDRAAKLLAQAAALQDMADVLTSYPDPAFMNEALRMRLGDDDANPDAPKFLGFGAHPLSLLDWRARYFAGVPADRVETALREWSKLSPGQQAWLAAGPRSLDESKWEALAFVRRTVLLHAWETKLYAQLMGLSPKTPDDENALKALRNELWIEMDGGEKRLSGERMIQGETAVEGLQRLGKMPPSVRESKDPAMLALLAKARNGASPEEVLDALEQIFDKSGQKDDAVQTAAPSRPDQKITSLDPKLLSAMLGSALRAEIRDVPAGRGVDQFFETHPLNVQVRELASNMAQFQDTTGELVFNERFIEDWIRSQGLSAKEAISNPARLHQLVMILVPNFVHESTHQIQKAWADANGLYTWNAQHQEIEAEEVEVDYVLQKEAKDPGYRKFLEQEKGHSVYIQQALLLTADFLHDPRAFRASVRSDYYAGLPSLESMASTKIQNLEESLKVLRAEKSRRATLTPAALAALAKKGYDKDKDFDTMSAWAAYLTRVKSGTLDKLIAGDMADRDKTASTFEMTRARETSVLDGLETDADNLIRGGAPAPVDSVPAPSGS